MKYARWCADVLPVMQRPSNNPQKPDQPDQIMQQRTLGLSEPEGIAVSASELIEMIRNGTGHDLNELVRRTLEDRHAA